MRLQLSQRRRNFGFETEHKYNLVMKDKAKEYRPRVVVQGNTGTRIMRSKKDKSFSRQTLKLELKRSW